MATVLEVIDNETGALTGRWYGAVEGDLFEAVTDGLNEENGWTRVRIKQADFASLIRNRAKRTRFNALTGEDLTLPPTTE